MIRDSLKNKYPRYHFNKQGKTKIIFDTIEMASKYLKKMNLFNYTIYKCRYCNKYHISKK